MISVARTAATSQPTAAQTAATTVCWQHGTLARRSCPLPRVWPFLLILKEPLLVAMRPGRKLEPHQCHQDSDAYHRAGDEPGDSRVASGDGGQQARGRAGQDRGDHAD